MTSTWADKSWEVIDCYFRNTQNYLSKVQLDAYNMFVRDGIPKAIRQFNPIDLSYGGDRMTISIIVGGSRNDAGDAINDGSSIKVGKPIIQEKIGDNFEYRQLYPNEARLKNLTYRTTIYADVAIDIRIKDQETYRINYKDVEIGDIPIMLHSEICSLNGTFGAALTELGECPYDQGGYFLIDGKEKIILGQERQVENRVYVVKVKDTNSPYGFIADLRSAPEAKKQPARITRLLAMNERQSSQGSLDKNTLRVSIPQIDGEIPLFVVMRALGLQSDKDIISAISVSMTNKQPIIDFLYPSIVEGATLATSVECFNYLASRISPTFMKTAVRDTGVDINTRNAFLMEILRNHMLPHLGNDLIAKAHFLAYMTQEIIKTALGRPSTDRDSFIHKRVDVAGFLITDIFRDLYFRIQKRIVEQINVKIGEIDINREGAYWAEPIKGTSEYPIYDFFIHEERPTNAVNNRLTIRQIVDRKIMDAGWDYAFKKIWGLKDAPGKEGVVQDMNRMSYLGFLSHIRRINTPLPSGAKMREPHSLHGTQWGIMCPDETPDGANVGTRKSLAMFAQVSFGTSSMTLQRVLFANGVLPLGTILDRDDIQPTRVFLNERIVGWTIHPASVVYYLRLLRRNALINVYTSIAWDIADYIIKISTDSGRCLRPVAIVRDGRLAITDKHIDAIRKRKLTWKHLIGGFRTEGTDEIPYDDYDATFKYIEGKTNNIKWLEDNQGVIEYLDCYEENTCMIAVRPEELAIGHRFSHCEINPVVIFGALANNVPFMNMNQHPRNQFSTAQVKQALGIYATNFRDRIDTKGQILKYPQVAVVRNKMAKYINSDKLPQGMNAIVAIGCFTGYNQDDSIMFNKSSIERGLFHTTKFRAYSAREEIENRQIVSKISRPDPATIRNWKSGGNFNYSKLDDFGIVPVGTKVTENDILVGRLLATGEYYTGGGEELIGAGRAERQQYYDDDSIEVRRAEDGFVDRVYSNLGTEGQRYVKIRVRKDKTPELGDKFCSRMGQKGVCGMLIRQEDMPTTASGITPDLIVNTHAFPSRMTIAQFMEVILGKTCLELGIHAEVAAFSEIATSETLLAERIGRILEGLGYQRYGNEILYNGRTGEMLAIPIFIGPTFYQRLTHQVSDKFQARSTGTAAALTHQPVGGRSLGGGGRIGEMERDGLLSHGVAGYLKEAFMERSDKYGYYISSKTGQISACNPSKGIFNDFVTDEVIQDQNEFGDTTRIPLRHTDAVPRRVETPYAFKLLLQEIETMGVNARLITQSDIQEWSSPTITGLVGGGTQDALEQYTTLPEIATHSINMDAIKALGCTVIIDKESRFATASGIEVSVTIRGDSMDKIMEAMGLVNKVREHKERVLELSREQWDMETKDCETRNGYTIEQLVAYIAKSSRCSITYELKPIAIEFHIVGMTGAIELAISDLEGILIGQYPQGKAIKNIKPPAGVKLRPAKSRCAIILPVHNHNIDESSYLTEYIAQLRSTVDRLVQQRQLANEILDVDILAIGNTAQSPVTSLINIGALANAGIQRTLGADWYIVITPYQSIDEMMMSALLNNPDDRIMYYENLNHAIYCLTAKSWLKIGGFPNHIWDTTALIDIMRKRMSDLSVIATNMEEILVKMPTTLISPELEDTDMMDERLRTMAHVDRANDDLYGRWSGVAQRSWYIERGEPLKGIIQVELLENTLPVAMFIGEYVQPGKALPTRIHIGGKGRDIAEDIMKRVRVMLNVLREEYISTELADREYIAEFDKSRDNITITNRKVHYTIKDIPKIDTRSVREFEVSMPVEEQANIEVTEIGGDIKVINIQETMMTGGAPIEDTDIGDEYNEDIELEAEEYNEDGAEDNENGEMDNNPEISEEKIDLNIAE